MKTITKPLECTAPETQAYQIPGGFASPSHARFPAFGAHFQPSGHFFLTLGGIYQLASAIGLSAPPPEAAPDLEEMCWLCGAAVEEYDPAGHAWCEECLRAGQEYGWQELLDALPEPQRADPLAIYAAAAYHLASRPKLWLDAWRVGTGETLQGVEVFARLGAALSGEDDLARREARERLTALATSGGVSLRP